MKARIPGRVGSLLVVALIFGSCGGSAGQDQPAGPVTPTPDATAGSSGAGGGAGGAGGAGGTAGRGGAGGGGGTAGAIVGRDAGGGVDAAAPKLDVAPPKLDTAVPTPTGDAPTGNPAGPAGPWARSISVGLVEVAQATFIKLGDAASTVEVGMRNAPIIEGRPLMVRVHVTPGAGYMARRLRGVVAIDYGGAAGKQFEEAKMISGASDPERLETTFNVLIPAADVKPTAGLWVAIYEAGMAAGADPMPPPRFPATGGVDLAVKGGRMVLDVVGVPVTGPGGPLADTPQRRAKLENDLYDIYPVQKVNLKIREPVTVDAKITERTAAFGLLRDARTADGASMRPWEYYHLLVARDDTTFTFAGTAGGGGGSANDPGSRRVALTLVGGRAIDGNTNTTAHEIGHNHGEGHIPACGADGSGSSTYPLAMGMMATSGWSLSENALKTKARFRELMGYCRPRWISDYMWIRFEARVRTVSAGMRPAGMTLADRSLLGYTAPGERPNWGVVPERLVDESAILQGQRYARLVLEDGSEIVVPVSVQLMSDGVTREIAVNLPMDLATDGAEIWVDGERLSVSPSSLPSP